MNLRNAGLEVTKRAIARLQAGQIPTVLGLSGLAAIMHDKISRFFNGYGKQEILDLAADAVVLASLVITETVDDLSTELEAELEDEPDIGPMITCPWCGKFGELYKPSTASVEICIDCAEKHSTHEYEEFVEVLASQEEDDDT